MCCDLAEWWMQHHNRGYCLATIISCLSAGKDNDKNGKEMVKRKRVV